MRYIHLTGVADLGVQWVQVRELWYIAVMLWLLPVTAPDPRSAGPALHATY